MASKAIVGKNYLGLTVTYRVYIKKDYKSKIERVGIKQNPLSYLKIIVPVVFIISAYIMFDIGIDDHANSNALVSSTFSKSTKTELPVPSSSELDENISLDLVTENINDDIDINTEFTDDIYITDNSLLIEPNTINDEIVDPWLSVTVKSGDSLALIFSRLGLSPSSLYKLMSLGKDVSTLKRIQPGQVIKFHIEDDELISLEYEMNLTKTLKVSKNDKNFKSEVIEIELERIVKNTSATINDSLFLSAKRAGLTDNLIMQLVAVYGWDIDFALDIREGDSFTVIYEEQNKDGIKVSDGPIIAAEFVNRNTPLRAIRYTHEDGRVDYYADNGDAMRKAFLRTPVDLARISSRFNLKRKHPILNRIRAHKGVDYAASTGTPIKATGDGTVVHAGRKGGYGRTVILKHGGKYSTLYAHLHRYARGVRTGSRVKQGQIIGYVGKSGLATGPHLHYEFRINGVHRNPLTVKLPKVESISKEALPEFKLKINPMIVELDRLTGKSAVAVQQPEVPIKLADAVMEDG